MPKSRGRTPRSRRPAQRPRATPGRRAEADETLLDQVAAALRVDHPLALLGLASGLLNALDPRNDNPFDRTPTPERPPLGELLDSLAGAGEPEAAALALAMAHLGADDLARTRTVRTVRDQALHLPRWLWRSRLILFVFVRCPWSASS